MRRQRDAAFTDEIITNIKQFQTDTDCDKPDEMIVSHAKRKTCNSLVTGQKNVGYLGDSDAHLFVERICMSEDNCKRQ